MAGMVVDREDCVYEGKSFSHGSEICSQDLCMLCNDGTFEVPSELSSSEGEFNVDPGEAYFRRS
jgi:hypothetical protein